MAPTGRSELPLDGIIAVAVEQAVAAPFATRQLADLGARVIKVERPDGGDLARGYDDVVEGLSAYFAWLNRSKESVVLDLKSEGGRETMDRLVARADIVIQNLAPRAAARLGLDAATLHDRDARLIACDLSGYGVGGPYGHRKAYDLLIQAETGLISITGTPESGRAGISIADIAGGMYAFANILAALYERERTGNGAALEISLFDGLVEWMAQPYYTATHTGRPQSRQGARHATIAPYGRFATADGALILAVQSQREWRRLCCDVLDHPEWVDDPRFATNPARVAHRDALDGEIGGVLAALPTVEVEGRLAAADLAYALDRTPLDLGLHPQLSGRDRWRKVSGPDGCFLAPLPPFSLGNREPRMGPVPALGEHTSEILAWLEPDIERAGTLDCPGGS